MRIIINYNNIWNNSFLDGDNNEPLPKKGRKYIAAGKSLKLNSDAFKKRVITKDTVMGVLCRLIGDQRKLYQSRESDDYYFKEMEKLVTFNNKVEFTNNELVFLRNKANNLSDSTGIVNVNDPSLTSDYSQELWGILSLSLDELCDFIINNTLVTKYTDPDPIVIQNLMETISKSKPVSCEGDKEKAYLILKNSFDKCKALTPKGELKIAPLYCTALYLQMDRLSSKYDMSSLKTARGGIAGISHNNISVKDFKHKYSTGEKKKILFGNPYIKETFIKGQGKITEKLTTSTGELHIILDVNYDKAKELKTIIGNAGVSVFQLGKKGLACVNDINLRKGK